MEGIVLKDITGEVYLESAHFAIDEIIRGVALQERWQGNVQMAVKFGRRMMDVAYHSAMGAKEEYRQETIGDWEKLAKLSKNAHSAIEKTMAHLVFPQFRINPPLGSDGQPKETADLIWHPLHHMHFHAENLAGLRPDAQKTWQQGHDDAALLRKSSDLLKWISDESERSRNVVAGMTQNPGKPEVRAFTEVMVHGWIFLTGKKPSHKNVRVKQVLADTWADISRIELDWEHPLRVVCNRLTKENVAWIAQSGPDWK